MKKLSAITCLFAALCFLLILLPGCTQLADTVTVYCVSSITHSRSSGGKNITYTYDARGNLLEIFLESSATSTNSPAFTEKTVHTYDESGNMLTKAVFDTHGQQKNRWSYTYDAQGNLLSETTYDAQDAQVESLCYTYDENGNMLSKNHVTIHGAVQPIHKYTYDAQGHMLTDTSFDARGQQASQWRYTYDTRGNLLSEKCARTGEIITSKTYSYDQSGNRLTQTEEFARNTYRRVWSYDAQGRMLTEQCTLNGAFKSSVTYSYDLNGNLLELLKLNSNGNVYGGARFTYDAAGRKTSELDAHATPSYHYEWKYDEKGNLITVILDANGPPVFFEMDYVAIEVPRAQAESILDMQRSLLEQYKNISGS